MNTNRFTSVFANDLAEYVKFKEQMGFYGRSRITYLRRFDVYCSTRNLHHFDRDTVEGWVLNELKSAVRCRSWMSYIRDFGKWMRTHKDRDAYVLSDRWKAGFTRSYPYLLASDEIEKFFSAAAHTRAASPWAWQAAAFFTLMHSCGLRTCEARGLLVDQVDLDRRSIDIVHSKARRSRRLPITSDVAAVLATCDEASRSRYGALHT